MIWTIGHSTLPIDVFVAALEENGIAQLVDIRTVPRSRFNPQFGTEALAASLANRGISYRWLKELGGLRRPSRDSINSGWRNTSFRGYADYMQTATFRDAITALVEIGKPGGTVIMCSEAVPWRCHRSLVGDALLVRACPVEDVFVAANGKTSRKPHVLTSFARLEGARLWYPAADGQHDLPFAPAARPRDPVS